MKKWLCRRAGGLAVLIMLGNGCAFLQKPAVPPAPGADWKGRSGQVRYQDPKRSFVADVNLRQGKNADQYSLEVAKAGTILLKLDRSATEGWATGPLAHFPFHGLVKNAPKHLQPWYLATAATLEKKPGPVTDGADIRVDYRLQP